MANLAETNTQNAAAGDKPAFSLLSALKASMGLTGDSAGGLFASLLAETKQSMPKVQPAEPSPVQPRSESNKEDLHQQKAQMRDAVQSPSRMGDDRPKENTVSRAEQSTAPKRAEADAPKKQETREEGEAREEAPKVVAQSDDSAQAPEGESKAAVAALAVAYDDQTTADEGMDEETLMAFLAAFGPLDGSAKKETAETPLTTTETKSDEAQETLEAMMSAEMAALMALHRTATKTEGAGGVTFEKKSSDEEGKAQREGEILAGEISETLTAQNDNEALAGQLKGAGDKQALANEKEEQAALDAMQKPLAQAVEKGEVKSTLSPTEKKENGPHEVRDFFLNQTQAPETKGGLTIATLQQAVKQNAAVETTVTNEASASAGKTATTTTPVGTVGRTAGSYDFASQLSASRVAKGGTTGLPQAIEQVAVQLHKTVKDGKDEMTIQLRPAELGKIEIKLEFSADKKVHGTVVADNAATLSLLQKDSDVLQRALQDAGLQADAGCLQFSLRGDGQQDASAQNQSGGHSSHFRADGLASLEDGEGGDLAASDVETYYITPGRVNLRV